MITEKTVFVLGAGASCPYGFPTGIELKADICNNFKKYYTNYRFYIDTKLFNFNFNTSENFFDKIKYFTEQLKNSEISQIDKFINYKKGCNIEYYHLGRFAIFLTIFHYEKESLKLNIKDWYTDLFNKMIQEINKIEDFNKFNNNHVSIITFNYDRSLENYFFNQIKENFIRPNLNYKNKIINEDIINKIKSYFQFNKIYHIYGKIAELDWNSKNSSVEYGKKVDGVILIDEKKLDNINIIYDDRKNNQQINKMIEELRIAKKIFFLGFGFDEDNLKLLNIPNCFNKNQKLFATGFQLFEEERNIINNHHNMWWFELSTHRVSFY